MSDFGAPPTELTGHYPVPQPPSIPQGGPYFSNPNAGVTQLPGGADAFARDNRIDPNTGMLIGPGGLVPHQYGLQFQALQEQAMLRRREHLMRQGMNYTRGALGLLQSYRLGGSAAIESNVYGQLGNLSFRQAEMTQPIDLLGDYRREQDSQARMKANRANERSQAIQIAAIAVSAFGGPLGAMLGAAGGAMNTMNGPAGSQYAGSAEGRQQGGYQGSQPVGPNSPGITPMGPSAGPQGPSGQSVFGGQGSAMQSTLQPGQGGQGAPGGQQGMQAPGGPAGQSPQQPGQQGQRGAQDGQQGGAVGMGGPPVGMNGDFSPTAYSMRGAQMTADPIQQLVLASQLAAEVTTDPTWSGFTAAVDARMAARYRGAA